MRCTLHEATPPVSAKGIHLSSRFFSAARELPHICKHDRNAFYTIETVMVDPLITTIDDRYQILRVIGTGGMGTVYEAKHKVIGKRVAVKVLHAQLIHDTDATSRFLDEARAVASIGHANIVDCSDVGVMSNGAPFIVLEYLEGITLHDEIEMKILSVRRALRVIGQIASGLEAAHVQGVIHRDLKSETSFWCLVVTIRITSKSWTLVFLNSLPSQLSVPPAAA
jgi:serine/threonine protein kinase